MAWPAFRFSLALACLSLAGCSPGKNQIEPEAPLIFEPVTLAVPPISGQPTPLYKGFKGTADASGRAYLLSNDNGDVLEQRDIDIVVNGKPTQATSNMIFQAGPGRFVVLGINYGEWEPGKPDYKPSALLVSATNDAQSKLVRLPGNHYPIEHGANGIILKDPNYQTPLGLNPADLTLTRLAVPDPVCETEASLSSSGNVVQCYSAGGISDYEVATGKLGLHLDTKSKSPPWPYSANYAEQIIRQKRSGTPVIDARFDLKNNGLISKTLSYDENGNTKIFATARYPGLGDTVGHLLIKDASGDTIRDLQLDDTRYPWGIHAPMKLAGNRIIVVQPRHILVVSLDDSASTPPLRIQVDDGHWITASAFDSSGEWLLVVSDQSIGRFFHLKSSTSAH